MKLYAIYKNSSHQGNERAASGIEAIKKFVIASQLSSFIKDEEFLSHYSFKIAKVNVHYVENPKTHNDK